MTNLIHRLLLTCSSVLSSEFNGRQNIQKRKIILKRLIVELLLLQSRKSVHVNREIKPMNVDIVLGLANL